MRAIGPLVAASLAITACSAADNDDVTQPSSPGPAAARPYAVVTDDGWTLQEAIDPPPDAALVAVERPPLEWYAEYVQTSASESASVRLSGHQGPFDETRSNLEDVGYDLDDLSLQQW